MFIVALGFIGGFLLGGTLCQVISHRPSGKARDMAERGIVGEVDGQKITQEQYRAALAYTTERYKNENQLRDLTNEDYATIEQMSWERLVSDFTWSKLLQKTRVKTTEQEIIEIMKANPPEELRNNPQLLDDSGRFDREKYLAVMNNPQNRAYFTRYFRDLAEMLPKEKLRLDIMNSYRVTGAEIENALRAQNTVWHITSLYFGPRLVKEEYQPTDAEIEKYYRSHPDEFKTKEVRELRYVRFPFLVTAEDSANAQQQIQKAYQQLRGGESFNLTMLDFSNLAADTTPRPIPRSRLDARTDSVIRLLKPGQYSEPYLADYGWQIVMLDSISKESVALRRILVRIGMGADAVASTRDKVRDFIEQTKLVPFDTAATRAGLTVLRARPIVDRKPNLAGLDISSPSQLLDWALSAKEGTVMPEPVRGTYGYYVFELYKVKPAGIQKLEEAKEIIRWKLRQNREKEVWTEKTREALSQIKSGRTLEQLAEANPDIELKSERFAGITDARRRKGAEFAGALLALNPGQHSGVVETNWGAFIIRCDSLQETPVLARDQYYQQRIQQVGQELFQEFLEKPEVKDYRDPFSY